MKDEREDLSERLLNFAANIIKLVVRLNKTPVGRHVGGQLKPEVTESMPMVLA